MCSDRTTLSVKLWFYFRIYSSTFVKHDGSNKHWIRFVRADQITRFIRNDYKCYIEHFVSDTKKKDKKNLEEPYKPETISQRVKCQEYTKVTPKRIVVVIHLDPCLLWSLVVNHPTVKNPRNVWRKCALFALAIVVQVARGPLGWRGTRQKHRSRIGFFSFFFPLTRQYYHSWLKIFQTRLWPCLTSPSGFLSFSFFINSLLVRCDFSYVHD